MFDFLDNDIFVIVINIAFLIFIIYDFKKYQETKQKHFLLNIALTIGFAIWVMIPFYNKYITWGDENITKIDLACEHNVSLHDCLVDAAVKNYSFEDFTKEDKKSKDYLEFIKETSKECQD